MTWHNDSSQVQSNSSRVNTALASPGSNEDRSFLQLKNKDAPKPTANPDAAVRRKPALTTWNLPTTHRQTSIPCISPGPCCRTVSPRAPCRRHPRTATPRIRHPLLIPQISRRTIPGECRKGKIWFTLCTSSIYYFTSDYRSWYVRGYSDKLLGWPTKTTHIKFLKEKSHLCTTLMYTLHA